MYLAFGKVGCLMINLEANIPACHFRGGGVNDANSFSFGFNPQAWTNEGKTRIDCARKEFNEGMSAVLRSMRGWVW